MFDDLDLAIHDLLSLHPFIDTRNVDEDNSTRTAARGYVSMCLTVLKRESSLGHPQENALLTALRDVADRISGVLMNDHHRDLRRIAEMRALHDTRAALERNRSSASALVEGMPPVLAPRVFRSRHATTGDTAHLAAEALTDENHVLAVAEAAIATAETHGDTAPLDQLIDRLDLAGSSTGLVRLLRGRRNVLTGDLDAAVAELTIGAQAEDRLSRALRPQILATLGLVVAGCRPHRLDEGIGWCRSGRAAGLRPWRRTTAADTALARLLLRRALSSAAPSADGDIREAVRLINGRRRPWHHPDADDRQLLQEALSALDALADTTKDEHRHRAWRESMHVSGTIAARARLAVAWAEWAVGTGDPEYAAEAYQHLVDLASQDAVTRYGARAKQRVLAAAQEYAEEAGYWLARTGRYREAVLALETGRAVGLTEVIGRDDAAVLQRLRAAGRAELAEEYTHAVEDFDDRTRLSSPDLRQSWSHLRDVAGRVAAVTGADPLALFADYDTIAAETDDGALVYLGAAKAGGYALVVAARHDPQYVDLPKLDRATVAELVRNVAAGDGTAFGRTVALRTSPLLPGLRDIEPLEARSVDRTAGALRTLWEAGLRDVVLWSARGEVVTLVPVGLLSLLPLHAAGVPGITGDEDTEWRHVGQFSAIRYAPNVRSLRRCRSTVRQLAGPEQTLLAIDVPDGHGTSAGEHLRYVGRETAEITRHWNGRPTWPRHGCTWAEFHAAADEHTVWHIACHGSVDSDSIMDSRLYFADRQVTLQELRRTLKPSRRRLAVLSACQTNRSGSALPNEAVGLPSALVQIGFAGVIATAWSVDDLATTYLMIMFYRLWRQEGCEPAVALNRAQLWLRTATRTDLAAVLPDADPAGEAGDRPYVDPRYWAAFAYTGA
ncbi:CHAT domain-containing protein [Micromonospora sp. WMMC273]|uniref:CHAT domain-containing protein n=1 Tax=Micromonospora sp. WMMC273 TaxID=3015157 RepID=UPI0022B6C981|nr:CHAT domain-containing protein [Micromonospora sp. WMMC273]MCZ7476175.1 CHAT domain-containing protein [Micromonospora sp. WMMC273]